MASPLERGIDVAHEAVQATAVHAGRIAGILVTAVGQLRAEVGDLVWDFRDLAGDLKQPSDED
ncbi:hypothetical protein BH09ACT8_BH09ACT8_46680 [soil metagenome]